MKPSQFFRLLSALAVSAACALPAQATVLTFDNGLDTSLAPFAPLLTHESEMTQHGYWIDMFSTKAGRTNADLVGALVDGTDVNNTCAGLVCPNNNSTRFLAALNDGLPDIGKLDGTAFYLKSFDASFIAAQGDLILPTSLALVVVGYDAVGDVVAQEDFFLPGPVAGAFRFGTYTAGTALANARIFELAFWGYACTTATTCTRTLDKAQFALDNITVVPEPSSVALVGLALAGLFVARRQSQANV
jgi:hypothetical protein